MRPLLRQTAPVLLLTAAFVFAGCEALENSEQASARMMTGNAFKDVGEYTELLASSFERPFPEPQHESGPGLEGFLRGHSVRALIISKGDEVLFETYRGKHDETTLWNVHGISTTLIAAAVGAALESGKIQSPDEYISLSLPEYGGSGLTWRHLLTMTSHLAYRETPFFPVSHTARLFTDDDFSDLVHQPTFRENQAPGESFQYSSLDAQIMGEALEAVYDMPLKRIINQEVWLPMRAEMAAQWSVADTTKEVRAGYGLHMTSRDLWRFGRYLATDIQHHVDADFIAEMRGPIAGRGRFFRQTESRMMSDDWGYGFGTWFVRFPLNGKTVAAYGSIGLGGQAILMVPEYDMTIAVMANIPPKRGRTAFYRTLLEHALSYEG